MIKIDAENVEEIMGLTPLQEGMLFHHVKEPEDSAYFEQLTLELRGEIDWKIFEETWNVVARYNRALRTVYRWEGVSNPVQVVLKRHLPPLEFVDFSGEDEGDRLPAVAHLKMKDRLQKFNLWQVPFRVILVKINRDYHVMIVSWHHVLFDGWSNGIIIGDFIKVYDRLVRQRPLPPLKKPEFSGFVKWCVNGDREGERQFWERYLAGFATRSELPVKKTRDNTGGTAGAEVLVTHVETDLSGKIAELGKGIGVTPAAVFYCAWGLLLQKYCRQEDVVFGTTVSGRSARVRDVEHMVGLLINTLPLRIRVERGEAVVAVLKRVQAALLARETWETSSLTMIQGYSEIEQGGELFDSIIVVENYPLQRFLKGENKTLAVQAYSMWEMTHYDMTLTISTFNGISLRFGFDSSVLDRKTVTGISSHFLQLILGIVSHPQQDVTEVEMLERDERIKLMQVCNDTRTVLPPPHTVHLLLAEQAAKRPDKTALVGRGGDSLSRSSELHTCQFTFSEFRRQSEALAAALNRQGVRPGHLAGIIWDRSVELIIGIFGILKAGAAYLPLDPAFPEERIRYMLEDSGTSLLLLDGSLSGDPERLQNFPGTVISSLSPLRITGPGTDLSHEAPAAADLAYVIYTSGSTGRPKGVAIEHRALVNFVRAMNDVIEFGAPDRLLSLTTLSFDIFGLEIFMPPMRGACVVVGDRETQRNPGRMAFIVDRECISLVQFTPSRLSILLADSESRACLGRLRYLLIGGEILTGALLKEVKKITAAGIINLYGPTETTIWSTAKEVSGANKLNIGKPLANTEVFILDRYGHLQPAGVPGELYIAGAGLARGYLNQPELTARRFVPFYSLRDRDIGLSADLLAKKSRLYRTGDLVRWRRNGEIEFLDRIDYQVKIRGYRIEIGEIESRLLEHPHVKEAVVVKREKAAEEPYLCAYIVGTGEACTSLVDEDLRNHLSSILPEYMIPTVFMFIDGIPLTANGKVNRQALPEPEGKGTGDQYVPLRQGIETELAEPWAEILGIPEARIGGLDHFFKSGGHSLGALKLVARIQRRFGVEIPLSRVFDTPTLRDLADYIEGCRSNDFRTLPAVEEREYYPLTSQQRRLFALQETASRNIAYNMSGILLAEGEIDVPQLRGVLIKLVQRHEGFRTSFTMVGGQAVQKIHRRIDLDLQYRDLNGKPLSYSDSDALRKELIPGFIRPYDLSRAPLFRAGLLRLQDRNHLLVIDMHHIVSDAWSVSLLLGEFSRLYHGKNVPPLTVRYRDFAVWRQKAEQAGDLRQPAHFWQEQFSGEIPVLTLPLDSPRPSLPNYDGETVTFSLPVTASQELKKRADKGNVTLFVLILSLFYVLLSKLSGDEDICVGSPAAGRGHPDLQHLIGMFVNTLPLRNRLPGGRRFSDFMVRVKEVVLAAFENQEYPFEDLVESLHPAVDSSRHSLFDVMLVWQEEEMTAWESGGLNVRPLTYENPTAKFDLSLFAREKPGGIHLAFEYRTALLWRSTIERYTRYFKRIVAGVLAEPDIKIAEIDVLDPVEKEEIVYRFNDTGTAFSGSRTLHELFKEQVNRTPDSIAVMEGRQLLSYTVLNEKADQVAGYLLRQGVGPNFIVGIMMGHSPELLEGILGILKSGAAYLPIEADYPEERIDYILADSGCRPVLTDRRGEARLKGKIRQVNVSTLDIRGEGENSEIAGSPEDPAYVIYTSGSTGRPKGVMIEHRSVVNYIEFARARYVGQERINFALFTAISFDLTVTSMFTPLLSGNMVLIYDGDDKDRLLELLLADHRLEVLKLTPSHLKLAVGIQIKDSRIRRLIVGGEELEEDLAARVERCFPGNIEIYNEYGPTEATVGCMLYRYEGQQDKKKRKSVPIGSPVANMQIYLLDRNRLPVPPGVNGELYISGVGLSRGYVNQPELTHRRFLENPFIPGLRMYRSGDLSRRRPDGNIEFLGRIDGQLKIRGFRVETAEIEAALKDHEEVREAVVILEKDAHNDAACLSAYIIFSAAASPASAEKLDVRRLRKHLLERLPGYMIPSRFMEVADIPLTLNGKVDTAALRRLGVRLQVNDISEPPRNDLEGVLAECWRDILDLEGLGIDDDFFELGGDSIKAIEIAGRLRQQGLEVEVRSLFQQRTIRRLSKYVSRCERAVSREPVVGEVPLTPIQAWFFTHHRRNIHHFNQSVMIYREKGFSEEQVRQVFTKIVEHHDALRMVYTSQSDGSILQFNRQAEGRLFNLEVVEWRGEGDLFRWAEEKVNEMQARFNLQKGPLVHLGLLRTSSGDHLMMVIHHLVVDGVSWRILMEDFATACRQWESGEEIGLPEKTGSFLDWAEKLRSYAAAGKISEERPHWENIINTDCVPLPLDCQIEAAERQQKYYETIRSDFGEEETGSLLKEVNRAYGTGINDILLTALGLALREWGGVDRILVDMEGHGREESLMELNVSRTVGWFTSRFPVLLDVTGAVEPAGAIKRVKEMLRRIPHRGIGYGILRYLVSVEDRGGPSLDRNAEIGFNYLGRFGENNGYKMSELGRSVLNRAAEIENGCLIEINGIVLEGKLRLEWSYNSRAFKRGSLEKLVDSYRRHLLSIIHHCSQRGERESTPADFHCKDLDLDELAAIKNQLSEIDL